MAQNIVDQIKSDNDLSTFWSALKQSGMQSTLEGKGPYTVFAPNDQAFQKLDQKTRDQLMDPDNKSQLRKFIRSHIFSEKLKAADLKKRKNVTAMSGESVAYKEQNGKVHVGNGQVTSPDISCSNGIIHVTNQPIVKARFGGGRAP